MGAFGMWHWLRRRQAPAPSTAEDPADALRAKLDDSRARVVAREAVAAGETPGAEAAARRAKRAESRALVAAREAFEEGETPVDEADIDARRRSVHDQARARMDELRGE